MAEYIESPGMKVGDGGLWLAAARSVVGTLLNPALAYRGLIQFNGNQCCLHLEDSADGSASPPTTFGLTAQAPGLTLSSVAVVGVGDIGFDANQCTVESDRRTPQALTNGIVVGHSIRVTGNLFREGIDDAWLSAICAAPANTVTDNQAIHCMVAIPCVGTWTQLVPNTVLLDPRGCYWLNVAINLALLKIVQGASIPTGGLAPTTAAPVG